MASVVASTTVATLPRGPHKLPREQIVRSQRSRLMTAMAAAMAEKGYAETTVADVLRRARVSRETFYQQFSSKQDCFIAAYEQAATRILGSLRPAARKRGARRERFDAAIAAYLEALADEPAFARLYLLEVYAAGPEALEQRAAFQRRFADLVVDGLGARTQTERFACELLVAGIGALVTARLAADDIDGLPSLRAPLVQLVREALTHIRR